MAPATLYGLSGQFKRDKRIMFPKCHRHNRQVSFDGILASKRSIPVVRHILSLQSV